MKIEILVTPGEKFTNVVMRAVGSSAERADILPTLAKLRTTFVMDAGVVVERVQPELSEERYFDREEVGYAATARFSFGTYLKETPSENTDRNNTHTHTQMRTQE